VRPRLTYYSGLLRFEEGIQRLARVLEVANDGLNINWKKCEILKKQVNYLDFIIKDGTVTPLGEKMNAVKHFPSPSNQAVIQSFLGLTGYFWKFIPKYASIALPLTNLLRKNVTFCFADTGKRAFEQLQEALNKKPVLKI